MANNICRTNHFRNDLPLSRIACPKCDKLIIPRVVYYYGSVVKTVCPFCVTAIWRAPVSWFDKWLLRIAMCAAAIMVSGLLFVFFIDLTNKFR